MTVNIGSCVGVAGERKGRGDGGGERSGRVHRQGWGGRVAGDDLLWLLRPGDLSYLPAYLPPTPSLPPSLPSNTTIKKIVFSLIFSIWHLVCVKLGMLMVYGLLKKVSIILICGVWRKSLILCRVWLIYNFFFFLCVLQCSYWQCLWNDEYYWHRSLSLSLSCSKN